MTSCADLDPFFDGELAKDAAANFREHLVECSRCQVALRGRMQEETALEKWLERGAQHHPAGATPAPTSPARSGGVRPSPAEFSLAIIGVRSAQPIPTPHGLLHVMLSSIADVGAHFEIKRVDVN